VPRRGEFVIDRAGAVSRPPHDGGSDLPEIRASSAASRPRPSENSRSRSRGGASSPVVYPIIFTPGRLIERSLAMLAMAASGTESSFSHFVR